MTTVLIADDHPLVLSGLRALLETLEGIDVVGQASDGREAVSLAVSLRPDVVVMDLQMPELDGVEATRRIAERLPGTAVLVQPGRTHMGLEEAHRDLHIAPEEFDEVAAELSPSLEFFKVPQRETDEVLAAFAAHKGEVTEGSNAVA